MKRPLIVSVVIHSMLVALAIFGLPHIMNKPEIVEAVPVEIVANISELTSTNKPPVKAPPKEDPKKEPPPKKEEPPKPPTKTDTAPPPDDVLKEPPKPKDKPVEDKKGDLPKKEDKKKPDKKPIKKPDPKKEVKKDPQQDFDSLLKNLAADDPPQPETPVDTKSDSTPEPSPNVSRFSDVLSMSERDALIAQLSGCWNIMAGSANAESMAVEVKVVVNQDRTVREAKIVDQSRYNSDTFFRAAADAALRALRNPRCSPLNLPPDKYSEWQSMTINFDPKDMF